MIGIRGPESAVEVHKVQTNVDTTTVLVVDDERDVAELYSTWLTAENDVMEADGESEAHNAGEETVEVAFSERQTHGMSGYDGYAQIK